MKSLVIYFSRRGENYMRDGIRNIDKGNTEVIAEFIHDITGADLFKVLPLNDYPYDYRECCDMAKKEISNNLRPAFVSLPDIHDYDVIYVGGPVWYGHFPCVLLNVLESLDFSGKTVYPFVTHEGSSLGMVMDDVSKVCLFVKDGLAICGSDVNFAKEEVRRWCLK